MSRVYVLKIGDIIQDSNGLHKVTGKLNQLWYVTDILVDEDGNETLDQEERSWTYRDMLNSLHEMTGKNWRTVVLKDRYFIRDREAENEIDSFAELPEACDTLTEYVEQDADGETIPEDPYDRVEFFNNLIEFYEIYDTETEKPVRVHWDINDNCVVFC